MKLTQLIKVLFSIGAKVCSCQIFRKTAAAEHQIVWTIRGKEQLVHAVFLIDFCHRAQIILVVAVAAIFIFHLYRNDVSTVFGKVWTDFLKQSAVVVGYLLQKARVIAAQMHLRVGQQPGWQTAKIKLGADVRTRAKDHIQPQFLRGADKLCKIQHPAKIKFPFFSLVQVPAGIGLHRIKSAGTQLFKPILPVSGNHAKVMDGTGHDSERFFVKIKSFCVKLKSAHLKSLLIDCFFEYSGKGNVCQRFVKNKLVLKPD
ncbi:unknown [Clostridium sp. CAG:242]|nr:unknown [Clostridium sp. CAG:242]